MQGAAENAWRLENHVVSADGSAKLISWKVWYSSQRCRLLWDLSHILDSCGKGERSENTKLKNVVKSDLSKWQQWWTSVGLSLDACFGRSKHALRSERRPAADIAAAEDVHWVSTSALLVILLWWCQERKTIQDRSMCRQVAAGFLRACLQRDFVAELPWVTMSRAAHAMCGTHVDGTGCCGCYRLFRDQMPSLQCEEWSHVTTDLLKMMFFSECASLFHHAMGLLRQICSEVDDKVDHWGIANLLEWQGLPPGH